MAEYTPAPWTFEERTDAIRGPNDEVLATSDGRGWFGCDGNLMAAGHEMLAALRQGRSILQELTDIHAVNTSPPFTKSDHETENLALAALAAMDAAIAKAEGKS